MRRAAAIATATSVVALLGACVAAGEPTGTANAGIALPQLAAGCSQLNKLPSIFPAANTVGFVKRSVARHSAGRQPIWPGWCRRTWWGTTYTGPKGSVEVGVALYATAHDVDAALAEPAYGPVRVQPNGSRVRSGSTPVDVNGVPSMWTGAASAYRNLFISSVSIASTKPVPVAAQLRIHRAIQTAFRSLR